MRKLSYFLLFFLFSNAFADEKTAELPDCSQAKIQFFGEIHFGKVKKNAQGKIELTKQKRILPLTNFHNPHSNDWGRILLQIPPEMRTLRESLNILVSSHKYSNPNEKKNKLNLPLGKNEEGYFPLLNSSFEKMLPVANSPSAGVIEFVVKLRTQAICKFDIFLEGQPSE